MIQSERSIIVIVIALLFIAGSAVGRNVELCVLRGDLVYAWDRDWQGIARAPLAAAMDWESRVHFPLIKRAPSPVDDAWRVYGDRLWVLQTKHFPGPQFPSSFPMDLGLDVVECDVIGRRLPPDPSWPARWAESDTSRLVILPPQRYPKGPNTKTDLSDVEEGLGSRVIKFQTSYANVCQETQSGLFCGCRPLWHFGSVDQTRHIALTQFAWPSAAIEQERRDEITMVAYKRSHDTVSDPEGDPCHCPPWLQIWKGQLRPRDKPTGPSLKIEWTLEARLLAEGIPDVPFHCVKGPWRFDGEEMYIICDDGGVFRYSTQPGGENTLKARVETPPDLYWSKETEPVLAVVWDQDHQRGYAFTATKYFPLSEERDVRPLAEPLKPIVNPEDQWPLLTRCLEVVRQQRAP